MLNHPNPNLDLALMQHQERIAEADRWRQAAAIRRASRRRAAESTRPRPIPSTLRDLAFRSRRAVDLADWLRLAGDAVAQYPLAELDGRRRAALAALVNGLSDAAREGGADVTPTIDPADPAVVMLRVLGRLASSTADSSVRVSRRRARMLRSALEQLRQGTAVETSSWRSARTDRAA